MKSRFFTCCIILLLLTSGCSSNVQSSHSDVGENMVQGKISIDDCTDETIILDEIPQRIVVLGKAPYMLLHMLYMFSEGRDRLIAVEAKSGNASSFLPIVDDRYQDVIQLGPKPGVEEIAALHPDLVLVKNTVDDGTRAGLEPLDIPVIYFDLESIDQFLVSMEKIGKILGNQSRSVEIIEFYQDRLSLIEDGLENLADEEKPDVVLIEYSSRNNTTSVQVPPVSWIQTRLVQMSGANPVWLDDVSGTDGWQITNFEQIAVWDADKIVVVVWFMQDARESMLTLLDDNGWQALEAVKNQQIYTFPVDYYGWDTPDPRWILGLEWLTAIMHPDRFSDLNIEDEVITFFDFCYGMTETSIQEHILNQVDFMLAENE